MVRSGTVHRCATVYFPSTLRSLDRRRVPKSSILVPRRATSVYECAGSALGFSGAILQETHCLCRSAMLQRARLSKLNLESHGAIGDAIRGVSALPQASPFFLASEFAGQSHSVSARRLRNRKINAGVCDERRGAFVFNILNKCRKSPPFVVPSKTDVGI
jgi:hypothetical protein